MARRRRDTLNFAVAPRPVLPVRENVGFDGFTGSEGPLEKAQWGDTMHASHYSAYGTRYVNTDRASGIISKIFQLLFWCLRVQHRSVMVARVDCSAITRK